MGKTAKGSFQKSSEEKHFTVFGFFIWALAILFFLYEFFLRVLPATVATNIIHSLDISMEQFAFIGSAYYLTYSFMQIPVGLLLDRFSVRLLVSVAASICSFGALWFSFAHGFIPAFLTRLMIGLGSSFGFVSLMIVTLNWFPKKKFAFLLGCGQFLGTMGPLLAGGPIALILAALHGNWRLIFLCVALFGVILTIFIAFFIRGKPINTDTIVFVDRQDPIKKRLKALLSRSQIWIILIYSATVYVALPLLGAFWGTVYLETKGFSKSAAAFIISMIWIGFAIGGPVIGKFSDSMKRRKPFMTICAAIGIISSLLFLFTHSIHEYYLSFLFFLIGISGSGVTISFAIISENATKNLRATALGMNNTALMGFAAIIPPFVTSIIQSFTKGNQFTEAAFEKGFLIIPICFLVALFISVFGIRETYCREQSEIHTLSKT